MYKRQVLSDGVAGALDIADVAAADEGQRDGVVEDAGLFHELVRGSANGDSEGGSAGLAVFHNLMLIGSETVRMNRMTWIGWALLSALFAAATALLAVSYTHLGESSDEAGERVQGDRDIVQESSRSREGDGERELGDRCAAAGDGARARGAPEDAWVDADRGGRSCLLYTSRCV